MILPLPFDRVPAFRTFVEAAPAFEFPEAAETRQVVPWRLADAERVACSIAHARGIAIVITGEVDALDWWVTLPSETRAAEGHATMLLAREPSAPADGFVFALDDAAAGFDLGAWQVAPIEVRRLHIWTRAMLEAFHAAEARPCEAQGGTNATLPPTVEEATLPPAASVSSDLTQEASSLPVADPVPGPKEAVPPIPPIPPIPPNRGGNPYGVKKESWPAVWTLYIVRAPLSAKKRPSWDEDERWRNNLNKITPDTMSRDELRAVREAWVILNPE